MSKYPASGGRLKEKVKSWILRFVKFNIVGFVAFLAGTGVYLGLFGILGFWSYVIASASGGRAPVRPHQLLEHEKEGKNVLLLRRKTGRATNQVVKRWFPKA